MATLGVPAHSSHSKQFAATRWGWTSLAAVLALALGAPGCTTYSGAGGGGVVQTACVDTSQCAGYPCVNGFCDFSSFDASGDSGAVADTGGAAGQDSGPAVDSGPVVDTGGAPDTNTPDTGLPDTNTPDTGTPDAGCKNKRGQPCCTSDAMCATGSTCTKGTCNLATGDCQTTTLPNCCQSNSDCGDSANPCQQGVCNTSTKACSFVDAENGDPCNDGDPCTDKDNCVVGKCSGQPKSCDDGELCTTDSCQGGTCKHDGDPSCCTKGTCCDLSAKKIKAAGSQCGDKPKVEYRCSQGGGAVEVRQAFATCDGTSSGCADAGYVWSGWKAVQLCSSGGVCEKVGDAFACSIPNKTSSCTSGVCCDTTAGKIKGKGAKCATSVYGSKTQCVGNTVYKSNGYKGCSGGSSSSCYSSSSYRHWLTPAFYQACSSGQTCYVSSSTSAYCKSGSPCSSGACCDVKGTGAPLPKYTPCGSTAVKSELMCSADNTQVLKREAVQGCSGSSSACSSSSSYHVWGEWKVDTTCGANTACVGGEGTASCKAFVLPKQCSSGTCCNTSTGRYKPQGTKCGTSVKAYKYTCAPGFKSVQRSFGYYGCTGNTSSCTTSSTYYHWTTMSTYKTCSSSQTCKQSSSSSTPFCSSSPYTCSSGTCCDATKKTYSPKYTSCSSTVKSTRRRCSADGKTVVESTATYGCAGYGSSCSTSSSNYSWSDYVTKQTCTPGTHCVQSSSYSATCAQATK